MQSEVKPQSDISIITAKQFKKFSLKRILGDRCFEKIMH
jgi:hypothetical protein